MIRDPIYKRIGELIQARRKNLGLKQENLAHSMGISRGSLANIETGKQGILVHQLYKFAAQLDLAPSALLPALQVESSANDRKAIPISGDFKANQKKQIADLFLTVDTSQKPKKEEHHVKAPKR